MNSESVIGMWWRKSDGSAGGSAVVVVEDWLYSAGLNENSEGSR